MVQQYRNTEQQPYDHTRYEAEFRVNPWQEIDRWRAEVEAVTVTQIA